MQTKKQSAVEALMNILLGYSVNFSANMLILPMLGFDISLGQNAFLGILYTIISFLRSYIVRRFYNWKHS
jgi:hypothetical protein